MVPDISDFRTKHIEGSTAQGDYVTTVHLKSESGAEASILTLGARVLDFRFSDGPNRLLSFDTLSAVEADPACVCVAIGRVANRTRAGKLTRYPEIDAAAHLQLNDGANHIHGGYNGFSKCTFTVREQTDKSVELFLHSPDGGQGYPSSLEFIVRYELAGDAQLDVTFITTNVGSQSTVSNITLHPYFDLSGQGGVVKDSALSYKMHAPNCSRYLELDDENIPTGTIASVKGTRFDFTEERTIDDGAAPFAGYDNFFVASTTTPPEEEICSLATFKYESGESSGVQLEVLSNQPGFQMYTANGYDGTEEGKFEQFGSVAIEPSLLIDGGNQEKFPTIELKQNESRTQRIVYKLSKW